MSSSILIRLMPVTLCVAALSAAAQTASSAARRPDPLDPRANVPALVYQSAFSRYRPTSDDKPIPWPEANETTARIGGWRAYAREAQRLESVAPAAPVAPAPVSTPAPKALPMPQGHGGHKMP